MTPRRAKEGRIVVKTLLRDEADVLVGLFIGGRGPGFEVTHKLLDGQTVHPPGQFTASADLAGVFPQLVEREGAVPVHIQLGNGGNTGLVISMGVNDRQLIPARKHADPDALDCMWLARKADSGSYSLMSHRVKEEIEAHGELRFEFVLRRRDPPDPDADRLKFMRRAGDNRRRNSGLPESKRDQEIRAFLEVGRVRVIVRPRPA